MDAGEEYREYRKLGMSKDAARHLVMKGVWSDELKGLSEGTNYYSEDEARMAVVHARQDIAVIVSDLGQIIVEQRRISRRLNIIILMFVVMGLVTWGFAT